MSEFPGYETVPRPHAVTIKDVQAVTCRVFEITHKRLIGPERCKGIARARAVGMYLARRLTEASYPEIGAAFGGRNHATVITAVRKVERMQAESEDFMAQVSDLVRALVETPRKAA